MSLTNVNNKCHFCCYCSSHQRYKSSVWKMTIFVQNLKLKLKKKKEKANICKE